MDGDRLQAVLAASSEPFKFQGLSASAARALHIICLPRAVFAQARCRRIQGGAEAVLQRAGGDPIIKSDRKWQVGCTVYKTMVKSFCHQGDTDQPPSTTCRAPEDSVREVREALSVVVVACT